MKRFEIHTGVSCSISIRPSLGYTTYTNVPLEDHPCRVHRALKKKAQTFRVSRTCSETGRETSGNIGKHILLQNELALQICCPSTLSSETGAAPNNLTWQQKVDENHNLLRHLAAAAAAAHGFSIVILYQRLS